MKGAKGAKAEWIDQMIEKRRARGYSEEELTQIRADQESRLSGYSDEEFAKALEAKRNRS